MIDSTKNFTHKTLENLLMKHGKKRTSELILRKTINSLQKKNKKSYLSLFKTSIANNYNILLIKTLKRSKKSQYKIPYIIKKKHRIILCLKNIIFTSRNRSKVPFFINFNKELISSTNIKSTNVHSEIHKKIYLQKNFAHYRWFV